MLIFEETSFETVFHYEPSSNCMGKEILFKASYERAMAHLRAHPEMLDIVNDRTKN